MKQLLTRQPAFLLEKNNYKECLLPGIRESFCYELVVSETLTMIPSGCMELIWNMSKKELYCMEYLSRNRMIDFKGDRLFGIHINYYYQCSYDIEQTMAWLEEITARPSFAERAELCRYYFNSILGVQNVHPVIRYGLSQIEETKGRVAIETIAAESGYSARHVERLFLQAFSCGPKRFCRCLRLLSVITDMAEHTDQKLPLLIENMGYSDQSHFQREFKLFIGMTPKQFIRKYLNDGQC